MHIEDLEIGLSNVIVRKWKIAKLIVLKKIWASKESIKQTVCWHFQTIFSFETTGLINFKFHMVTVGLEKVWLNGPGNVTQDGSCAHIW